jgi:hypothetical protein
MGTSEYTDPRITPHLTSASDITVEYARPLRKAKVEGVNLTSSKNR